MSACSPQANVTDTLNLKKLCKTTENDTSKTKLKRNSNFSYASRIASKWRVNNSRLARDNVKLKKDVRRLMQLTTENAVRCANLELSWRRRGETLARLHVLSRVLENQTMKLVDSIAELRAVCEEELAMSIDGPGAANTSGIASCYRHSVPTMAIRRLNGSSNVPQLSSKIQLINHVNPMVSGHPIVKPTITLQRLKLQNVPQNSPVQQRQPALENLNEDEVVEEMDLTTIPESSSDEDIVELPVHRRTSTLHQNMLLRVAEVPLERLSLDRISNNLLSRSNSSSEGTVQRNDSVLVNDSLSTADQNVTAPQTPVPSLPVETACTTDTVQNMSHVVSRQSTQTKKPSNVNTSPFRSSSSAFTRRSSSTGVKKYPPSLRARTPTSGELRKNQLNGEKWLLPVVTLKDVGSYLHNGTLGSLEELEEGKVKTGASAHPELKDCGNKSANQGIEYNASSPPVEDQTHINLAAEIGVMDYSTVSSISSLNLSLSSPRDDFLYRIQNEDPLEGPSWRYESGSRRRSKPKPSQLNKKERTSDQLNRKSSSTYNSATQKQNSSDTSKLPATENCSGGVSDVEVIDEANVVDMEFTECLPLTALKNIKAAADAIEKSKTGCVVRAPDVPSVCNSKATVNGSLKRNSVSSARFFNDTALCISSSSSEETDSEWKPSSKKRSQGVRRRRSKLDSKDSRLAKITVRKKNPPNKNVIAEKPVDSSLPQESESISQENQKVTKRGKKRGSSKLSTKTESSNGIPEKMTRTRRRATEVGTNSRTPSQSRCTTPHIIDQEESQSISQNRANSPQREVLENSQNEPQSRTASPQSEVQRNSMHISESRRSSPEPEVQRSSQNISESRRVSPLPETQRSSQNISESRKASPQPEVQRNSQNISENNRISPQPEVQRNSQNISNSRRSSPQPEVQSILESVRSSSQFEVHKNSRSISKRRRTSAKRARRGISKGTFQGKKKQQQPEVQRSSQNISESRKASPQPGVQRSSQNISESRKASPQPEIQRSSQNISESNRTSPQPEVQRKSLSIPDSVRSSSQFEVHSNSQSISKRMRTSSSHVSRGISKRTSQNKAKQLNISNRKRQSLCETISAGPQLVISLSNIEKIAELRDSIVENKPLRQSRRNATVSYKEASLRKKMRR